MADQTALLLAAGTGPATPIHCARPQTLAEVAAEAGATAAAWAAASGFTARPGTHVLLPAPDGGLAGVLAGLPDPADPYAPLWPGALARALPAGTYAFAAAPVEPRLAALGWLLGAYRFDRYRTAASPAGDGERGARLVAPDGADRAETAVAAAAIALTCDLINTPASDMGPQALAAAALALAAEHGATASVIVGEDLIAGGLPLIHAVGRASAQAPRLIDLAWGAEAAPKVTLVGKGVTFDTGGLDLKPAAGMALMKKDMGGAANVLGLAAMIMSAGLKLRLRVLIPAVENSVSAGAFRPGDILTSRKGLTVEIGNTDAEGRLVLADALALADEEAPELLIDMATLTGAARVALGPDLPPFFTADEALAADLAARAAAEADPLWRLPLWAPYGPWLDGQVADLTNAPDKPFAGALTAALFLARFVENAGAHLHLDIYAWSQEARPWTPRGGAAQGIRALFALLAARYGR
jgi:leucyl aminopeptidase